MKRKSFLNILSVILTLTLIGLFIHSCLKQQRYQFAIQTGILPNFTEVSLFQAWKALIHTPWFWTVSLFWLIIQIFRFMERNHSRKKESEYFSVPPSSNWGNQERQYQSIIKEQNRRIEHAENLFHQIKSALGAASLEADLLEIESEQNFTPLQNQLERCRQISYSFLNQDNNPADLLPVYMEQENIEFLVQKAINRIHPLLIKEDLELCSDIESADLLLDRFWMEEAIETLLSNAVRYAKKESCILIKGRLLDQKYELSITNSGSVPESGSQNLFERYFTSQPSDHHYGIGLHMAQSIVSRHYGSIQIQSDSNHVCFVIQIPVMDLEKASRLLNTFHTGSDKRKRDKEEI